MKKLLTGVIAKSLMIFIMIEVLVGCVNPTKSYFTQDTATIENTQHKVFIDEYHSTFKEFFSLLGDTDTDLSNFNSVTFYVGAPNKIDELDTIFRDYAKRIGTEHIAVFLKYGTQNYSKRLDEMKCFHLTPFEVPAIIYVDLKKEKCYYFSHSNGKLLANALLKLSDAFGSDSNVNRIKAQFDIEATVEDLVVAFPVLKPLRDLILRISRHICLNVLETNE